MSDIDTGTADDKSIGEMRERLALFWRKYMRLTRGGVLALKALDVIAAEETNDAFAGIVTALRDRIESGASMSDALAEMPEQFSLSQLEMIRAAEKLGTWDETLDELTQGLAEGTFH